MPSVSSPLLAGALALVAFLGLLDALYFVAVTYRWLRPDAPWLPRLCRMDQATCARIVDTREARVFGVPNSVLGVAWYGVVLGAAGQALATGSLPYCLPLLLVASFTVAFSAYLAWALVVRLRTPCILCFLGHGVNAALFVVLLLACLRA